MKISVPLAFVALLLAAAAKPGAVPLRANDTALHEGAYGPEPVGGGFTGPESVIRMESERLDIVAGKKTTTVRARFVFRSGKPDAPAQQLVGFPDLAAGKREAARRARNKKDEPPASLGGEGDLTGPLEDVQTLVDGREVPSELRYGYVREVAGLLTPARPADEGAELVAWHAVPVSFPPDRDVVIERRYRVQNGQSVATGGLSAFFDYTTATGGVWRGDIGELVADVRLRDGLSTADLEWDAPPGASDPETYPRTRPARGEWELLAPDHLRLTWRNFEPRTEKNRRGLSLWFKPRADAGQ